MTFSRGFIKLSDAQRKVLRKIYSNCFGEIGAKGLNASAYHQKTLDVLVRLDMVQDDDPLYPTLTATGKAWCEDDKQLSLLPRYVERVSEPDPVAVKTKITITDEMLESLGLIDRGLWRVLELQGWYVEYDNVLFYKIVNPDGFWVAKDADLSALLQEAFGYSKPYHQMRVPDILRTEHLAHKLMDKSMSLRRYEAWRWGCKDDDLNLEFVGCIAGVAIGGMYCTKRGVTH